MATPALAERVGRWGNDYTQHEALEMLKNDHGVEWSCTSLRKVLGSLRAGMAPHREGAQVDQLVHWLEQARTTKGRFRPTLSVGRDGIFVPLRHGVWQEGATATVSVGVVPDAGHMAIGTRLHMTAYRCRAALHDGARGSPHMGGQGVRLFVGRKRLLKDGLERHEGHP